MEYKFRRGDYVETKTGTIGYVSKAPKKGIPYWTPTKLSYNDIRDKLYIVGDSYCITFPLFPAHNDFNRIGQYDFTKKDEGKIEPLCEEYTKSFPICATTTAENGLEWRNIDIGAVGEKINELVEAINRLEDKVNEMAQG